MSGIDLHEFNTLIKKNNYFLINNRIKAFPSLNENSVFLRKILRTKTPTSNVKIIDFNKNKVKKFVHLEKKKNIPIKINDQCPIIDKKRQIKSNDIFNNQRLYRNIYDINSENITNNSNYYNPNTYKSKNLQIKTINDSSIDNQLYNKISINIQRRIPNTPDLYKPNSFRFYTYNNNDSDNDMVILKHKGKKLFKRSSFNTPEKYLSANRKKESELYRNTEELMRKRESVFKRKMKRESSEIRKEMLRREKDKDLKEEKLNIDIKTISNTINTENLKSKNRIKKINVNRNTFNNKIKKINKEIKPNALKKNIPLKRITVNIKDLNKKTIDNSNHIIYSKRKENKYKIDRNKTSSFEDINSNNDKNKEIKTIHINNNNKNNKINILYAKKYFPTNNVLLNHGNFIPKSTRNKNVNQKIKDNLNSLRKSKIKESNQSQNINNSNHLYNKSFDKFNSQYIFVKSNKKKYIEDYAYNEPVIYSNDKKVTISIHSLPGVNEKFLGKKMTKEKLKLQRIISIMIENENQRKINYFTNRNNHRTKDFYPLYSIKEEEKILNDEIASKVLKTESENEITQRPIFQRNVRMKYIQRIKNKK